MDGTPTKAENEPQNARSALQRGNTPTQAETLNLPPELEAKEGSENKTSAHGVRVDSVRAKKWKQLAEQLGVSQNRVISILLDNAVVVSEPRVSVVISKGGKS